MYSLFSYVHTVRVVKFVPTYALLRLLVRSLSVGARCLRTERFPEKWKGRG